MSASDLCVICILLHKNLDVYYEIIIHFKINNHGMNDSYYESV